MTMKKFSLILFVFLVALVLLYLFMDKDIRVSISYKYTKEGIEIIEHNKSNSDVFLFANPCRIYREKYKDTLTIATLRNGKREKWSGATDTKNGITTIACAPRPSGNPVFEMEKTSGIDKLQKEKVRLALIKQDSAFFTHFPEMTEKHPMYYFIKPKAKVVIKYKQMEMLEKGKYKLFYYKKGYDEDIKNSLLPEFNLLDSDEIEDNPLEFEVK